MKQEVRIIIEMKYFRAREDWSFESGWPTFDTEAVMVLVGFPGIDAMGELYWDR